MARLSPEVLGLAEAGYVIEDFATAEGNRVPVTVEDETPLYVAGTAALADESLGERADERVAETGEGGWKNVVGHAQMRSENDVGKEIYVKSINPGRWIGPLGVVMAFPSDQIYEKVQNKQVVALDKEVGKRIGLLKYGQAKEVEVSWGVPLTMVWAPLKRLVLQKCIWTRLAVEALGQPLSLLGDVRVYRMPFLCGVPRWALRPGCRESLKRQLATS